MLKPTEELTQLIRQQYNVLDQANIIAICPSDLAEAVFGIIDPRSLSPDLVRLAAVLELRQLSRAICRERHATQEHNAEQGSLFDMQLQPRYPAERDGDDAYVLRSYLTLDERMRNIERLRREANAKLAHADALQAETDDMVRRGLLVLAEAVQ
jgi:hypothetical protein